MPVFQRGDRVKYVGNADVQHSVKPGATATVYDSALSAPWSFASYKAAVWVTWDDTPERNGQHDGGYYADEFELMFRSKPLNISNIRPTTRGGYSVCRVEKNGSRSRPFRATIKHPTKGELCLTYRKDGTFYPNFELAVDLVGKSNA